MKLWRKIKANWRECYTTGLVLIVLAGAVWHESGAVTAFSIVMLWSVLLFQSIAIRELRTALRIRARLDRLKQTPGNPWS